MNELLLLNGRRATLRPGSVRRNLQINDIAEVKDRRANYSNTIDLPNTPENVALMDFLGVPGNTSLKPYRKVRADYYVNGIPQVTNGLGVLKESSEGGYKLVIYDGITDLAEAIKGKTLSNLNYSDLNHYLTTANAAASMEADGGYIYALANFGYKYYTEYKIENVAPSVYVSTLWDKIFSEAGVGYVGEFFQINEDFRTEVISAAKGYEVANVPATVNALGSLETEILWRYEISQNYLFVSDPLKFITDNAAQISLDANGAAVIDYTGVIKLKYNISYSCGQYTYLTLKTKLNGKTVNYKNFDYLKTSETVEIVLNVTAGDIVSLEVTASTEGGGDGEPSRLDERYELSYSITLTADAEEITGGQFIDFSLFVSEMDQHAFVKDIMQRYGLVMKPLRNSNAYEFIQFEDLLNRKADAEDWSDKLSALGPEAYGISYAKENITEYKYPDGVTSFDYNGRLVVDNDNAPASKPLWSSPYEIANPSHKSQGVQLYSVPIWEEAIEDGATVKKLKQTPVKIFRVLRTSTAVTLRLFAEANGTEVPSPAFLSLNNISLQYYMGNYYKAFANLVSRAKNRKAIFNFNELDVYNLDFFRLKFLKQTGRYYYLNLLSNIPGMLSEADLVEITKFSENLAPTVLGNYNVTMNYKAVRDLTINQLTNFTDPQYFDPEFDPVESVLFTGGFNSAVLLKDKDGVIINTQAEILAENFPVKIEDAGTTTNEHSAAFTFKIKDTGSGKFSEVEGTVAVTVREFVNEAPVANAGEDANLIIDTTSTDTAYIGLFGDKSYDNTGEIVLYEWLILNSPSGSTATISDSNTATPNASLNVPQELENIGTYEIQLTVTDEFGLSDTDFVTITVYNDGNKVT